MMKEIVTGYGGSVVLGFCSDKKFRHFNKFPRKIKKSLKKERPFLKFPKNNIDLIIDKCVHDDWLKEDRSFALKIADKPVIEGERFIYFVPDFPESDKVNDKHIIYKRENSEIVINV